jgi:cyclopropane fatty-acyl-phospholipid synthase-like methyltransferase
MIAFVLAAETFLVLLAIVITSILWSSLVGAPWEPTPGAKVRRMLDMADLRPGETVYDLGSGDGRVLIVAVREYRAQAVGIEIDPLRFVWTWLRLIVLGLHGQARVVFGNLFKQDVSGADVVTVYLTRLANERLVEKLQRELRPGARVVSHYFTFPDWEPADQDEEAELYLYRVCIP